MPAAPSSHQDLLKLLTPSGRPGERAAAGRTRQAAATRQRSRRSQGADMDTERLPLWRALSRCGARPANWQVTAEFLVTDATHAALRWLEIADVIVSPGQPVPVCGSRSAS